MPDIAMRFNRDILVMEGSTGAMLSRQGVSAGDCPELLNFIEPDTIASMHRIFKTAGAKCAITNTFGGSEFNLAKHGLADKAEDLNRRGVRIAKSITPEHILADMGPCGIIVDSLEGPNYDEAYQQYAKQAQTLASENPDAIFIETMMRAEDAICALRAAKSACDLPVIVSCVYNAEGKILKGEQQIEEVVSMLEAEGADVIGMNHELDSDQMLENVKRLCAATKLPKLAMPDTGAPSDGSLRGPQRRRLADIMAKNAVEYRRLGIQFMGTCCGTTPAFIGAIHAMIGDQDVAVG